MASHTTHTLQTTAAALRWAGSFVDISPLALPSPEHELTDPMRGALTAVPRSHPPPDQHLPSSPSLFHHQRHPSFPTSPSATSASASSSSNTPSAPSSHSHHSSSIYTPGGSRARLSSFWEDVLPQQNLDDVPEDAAPATDYFSPSHLQLSQPQPRARPRLLSGSSNNPTPTSSSANSASSSTSTLTTATLTTSPTTAAIPIPLPNLPLQSPALRRPSHSISLSDNPLPPASRRANLTRQSSSPLPKPLPNDLTQNLHLNLTGSHEAAYPLHLQQILSDQRTRNGSRMAQTQSPVPLDGDDVSVDENEYALDTDSTDTESNGDGDEDAGATKASGGAIAFPSMHASNSNPDFHSRRATATSASKLLPPLPVVERGCVDEKEGVEKEEMNAIVGDTYDSVKGDAKGEDADADDANSHPSPPSNIPPVNLLSVPNIHALNIPTASLASYLSLGYLPAPSPPDELERRRALYKCVPSILNFAFTLR